MKSTLRRIGLAVALAAGTGTAVPVHGATGERVIVDRHTGLAIFGFDPVAYFADAKPLLGRGELEYSFAGAIWRFHNEGNRAAFARNPDVYMPRYGGHDPVAVARGVALPGHPNLWLIADKRLYLFATASSRAAFAADPQAAVAAAETKWPAVMRELVP